MTEAAAERFGKRDEIAHALAAKPWLFGPGGRDPVENGRKGGSAPHRSKVAQIAKANVLRAKDGQSNYQLHRLELERQGDRERTIYRLDKEILEMDEMLAAVREQVEETLVERRRRPSSSA